MMIRNQIRFKYSSINGHNRHAHFYLQRNRATHSLLGVGIWAKIFHDIPCYPGMLESIL